MTDTPTANPAEANGADPSAGPPPLALALVHDFAQKGLTAAAAALAARGLIAPSQQDALVQLGLSAVLFAVSCAWTLAAARLRRARLVALARLADLRRVPGPIGI